MTDRTLDLAKALREAQLQRLEASLSARCATPVIKTSQPINEKDVASQDWFGIGQKSLRRWGWLMHAIEADTRACDVFNAPLQQNPY